MRIPNCIIKRKNGLQINEETSAEEYFEGVDFHPQISFYDGEVNIDFYGEDDTFLDEAEELQIMKMIINELVNGNFKNNLNL